MTEVEQWKAAKKREVEEEWEKLRPAFTDAAERIVAALDALPPHVAPRVWRALFKDDSYTLRHIGLSMIEEDRVGTLAKNLEPCVFLGDLQEIHARLGDTEPWGPIRQALRDVDIAFHRKNPAPSTMTDWSRFFEGTAGNPA